jgi:thiol-disulfide isomerase/thioredoxin
VKWRLKEIAFLKGLFRQKPNSEAARAQYVNAALLMESALSTQDALEVSELARAGHMRFLYSPNFALAELYLHHHTHLDLVPALLDAEIKAARHPPSGGPPQTPGEDIRNQILTEILAHRDLVEYWLAKRDLPNARAVMKELEADITRLASNAGGRAERITVVKSMERQRQALAHRVGMEAKPIELAGEPDPAQSRRDRLTAFYGTDLTGRRWTMADLDGKVTLINTWSTWCGPCRQELPYIQKLYDSFRNRKDRMVITISLDENDQLARNFIRKYGYTFPVIRSTELAAHINFAIDVPQNRLIDARRRIVAQAIEFSGNSFPSTITNLMDRMQ